MRGRSHIPNTGDVNACALEGTNSCLTPAARPLNENLYLPQAMLHSFPRRITGCQLSRIRRAFTGTLEPGRSGASPGQGIPLRVGKGYNGIVKAGLNVSPASRNRFPFPPPCFSFSLLWHPVLLVGSLIISSPCRASGPGRLLSCVHPAWCGRWSAFSGLLPAGRGGAGARGSCRFQ